MRKQTAVRPGVERLEDRLAPAVEGFESTAVGMRPSGWSGWSSDVNNDPSQTFQVSSGTAHGCSQAYSVTTTAGQTISRSWRNTTLPDDHEVTAWLYVNS